MPRGLSQGNEIHRDEFSQNFIDNLSIGKFQRSLPLLRQSLVTKETVIEGINPPSPNVAFSTISAQIPVRNFSFFISFTFFAVSWTNFLLTWPWFHPFSPPFPRLHYLHGNPKLFTNFLSVLGPNTSSRSHGHVHRQHRSNTDSNGAAGNATHRSNNDPTYDTANFPHSDTDDATADPRANDDRANK